MSTPSPDHPLEPTRLRRIGELAKIAPVIGSVKLPKMVGSAFVELFRSPLGVRPVLPSIRPRLLQLPAMTFAGPAEMVAASETLAKAGWFFDPDTPYRDFREAAAALDKGNPGEADELMAQHFASREAEIEHSLVESFPARAKIISSAFAAHRRGEYELSVLAFLSQADGLSAELRGGHFFLREGRRKVGPAKAGKKRRQTAQYVLLHAKTPSDRVHLAALEIELPILASAADRAPGDKSLNRHAVLHGESCDYGSAINSLRGISLLNHVAFGAETKSQGKTASPG